MSSIIYWIILRGHWTPEVRGGTKIKGPELGNSGPALRGRRWEGTHRLGCCLLDLYYQFKILLSITIFGYFSGDARRRRKGPEPGKPPFKTLSGAIECPGGREGRQDSTRVLSLPVFS